MKPLLAISVFLASTAIHAGEPVDYLRDVKPIFAKHCVDCHGPTKQKTGLRLDTAAAALRGNDAGKVIVPGKAAESLVILAITAAKDVSLMPPENRPRPTAAEIATLRKWIDAGAPAPKDEVPVASIAKTQSNHWAFQPPKRIDPPIVGDKNWPRNGIDRFVLARLEAAKVKPAAEADRVTLLRRVSLDLTGLPPTPRDTQAFLDDKSPDAYEKAVDRLLQ